jgi:hypothetical protein
MPFFSKKEQKEDSAPATANGSNGVVKEHKTKELNIATDHQSTANHTGSSEKKKSKKLHNKTADTPSPVPLAARSDKDAWQSMQSLEDALVISLLVTQTSSRSRRIT